MLLAGADVASENEVGDGMQRKAASPSVRVWDFLSANSADGNASPSATRVLSVHDVNKVEMAGWTWAWVCPGPWASQPRQSALCC